MVPWVTAVIASSCHKVSLLETWPMQFSARPWCSRLLAVVDIPIQDAVVLWGKRNPILAAKADQGSQAWIPMSQLFLFSSVNTHTKNQPAQSGVRTQVNCSYLGKIRNTGRDEALGPNEAASHSIRKTITYHHHVWPGRKGCSSYLHGNPVFN